MSNWYAEEFDDPNKPKTSAKKQHINPFAAGDAWQENGDSDSYDDVEVESDYRRDGKELVVTTGATLPAICIKSGSTRQLNPVTVTLSHSPPWAFLVGGVLLAMLFQKKCEVTYFVSQEVSSRIKKRKLFGGLGIVAGIFLLIFGLVIEVGLVAALGGVLIAASLVLLALASLGLAISKHQKGVEFWIRGFDKTFLQQLDMGESAA